jgi:hypothetical protein
MVRKLPFIFCLLLAAAFTACKKADIKFGELLIDNGYTQVIKVDTFTASLSTVYVDSFITSGSGTTLVGGYTDPDFGKITTQSYCEVTPPPYTDTYKNTSFDSIILILKLDRSYYGDTTSKVHIEISRLAESIATTDNNYAFYNTSHFATSDILGTKDVLVSPHQIDTISIKLSNALGSEFMQKLQNPSNTEMQNTAAFLQYFKGLRISTNTSAPLVFGCKDSVIVRLQYKQAGLFLESKYVDFTLNNSSHHFNNIKTDRSATLFPTIGPLNNVIPSSKTANKSFSQYLSGVMTKIQFPTIRQILQVKNYIKVLTAQLIIPPVKGTYTNYALPPYLTLATTTVLNQIGAPLVTVTSNGTAVIQSGNLFIDYVYGENTNYSYDVTSYIKVLVNDGTINQNGLLLVPPSGPLTTNFNRVIVGDKFNPNEKIQLQVYYVTVQ